MDAQAWHILRVTANLEQQICTLLLIDNPSLVMYNPLRLFSTFNRRNRIWTPRISSLFPGFLFLLVADPKTLNIRPSRNVFGFMRNASDRSYMKVLDREIERVKEIEKGFQEVDRKPSGRPPERNDGYVKARMGAQKEFTVRSFKELSAIASRVGLKPSDAQAA